MAELADVGINVIRLGFMWSGAQPAPGAFNATYVDIMTQIVDLLGKHGIFTLFDVHQVRSKTGRGPEGRGCRRAEAAVARPAHSRP